MRRSTSSTRNPQIVKGPDLWKILQNETNLYQDSLHPNPQGRLVYRQAWANAMLAEVYPASCTSSADCGTRTCLNGTCAVPPSSPVPAVPALPAGGLVLGALALLGAAGAGLRRPDGSS